MRTIAHISDLHFGTEDPVITRALLDDLHAVRPHLVVVSGDLTQRARQSQFATARRFLDALPAPILVVPGNHDMPLFNVVRRVLQPLGNYRRHINANLLPEFQDDELMVLGINTTRRGHWKHGRVSEEQIAQIDVRFSRAASNLGKILVTHHPFFPPPHLPGERIVGRGIETLQTLVKRDCWLVLAGHLHWAYSGDVRTHHAEVGGSLLVVQAGTATSRRRRGEPNAYNLLKLSPGATPELLLDVRSWSGQRFVSRLTTQLSREAVSGWIERTADRN